MRPSKAPRHSRLGDPSTGSRAILVGLMLVVAGNGDLPVVRGQVVPYNPYAAMPEWFGTLLILLFNLTFRHDFAGANGVNTLYLATALSQSGGEMQNAWGEESDEE